MKRPLCQRRIPKMAENGFTNLGENFDEQKKVETHQEEQVDESRKSLFCYHLYIRTRGKC
jgi:hypothetical protein